MVGCFKLIALFFIFTFSTAITQGAADKSADKDKGSGAIPNYGISGSARLTSHFIDRGLSMSRNNPAFNASFLMHLGSQFKFGFWGSNISELTSSEDNLWIKYVAQVFIDLQSNMKMIFYAHDDHYYKPDQRNGQRFGLTLDYGRFVGLVEWQDNFEATQASAMYFNFKLVKKFSEKLGVDLAAGYTYQNSNTYENYLDLQGVAFYKPAPTFRTELGLTLPSNTKQFGSRSNLGYFLAISFDHD